MARARSLGIQVLVQPSPGEPVVCGTKPILQQRAALAQPTEYAFDFLSSVMHNFTITTSKLLLLLPSC